jgi:hypothetical protein
MAFGQREFLSLVQQALKVLRGFKVQWVFKG